MKKSLLAVAAIGAFASAAQAQSSVTVYGILDVGYIGENTRESRGSSATPTQPNTKGTSNSFGNSAEQSSRLGFKGTEDLGGGNSAFFTIETGLTPSDTTAVSTFNTRQAFVGLKKNGLGDFAIGTQYTPIHNAVAATDPGQTNNIMGNLIYTNASGSLGAQNANSGQANTVAYTVRANNSLTLNTANFAGFQGHAILIGNNQNTNQTTVVAGSSTTVTGGINNQNGWGIGVDYTWNKLFVTANYQALTSKNAYTTTSTASGTTYFAGSPAIWNATTGGTNVQDNQTYVAATYDFGILKAYAQWVNRKATAQQDSGYYLKRSAEQIGVRSFITPTVEAWASGGLGKYTSYGQGSPTVNINGWQIGSNYWLSKRTNLYAIYGQTQTSNGSYPNAIGSATLNNSVAYGGSNYAIGVRHTF